MTKFTVVWFDNIQNHLASVWSSAGLAKQAITRAADAIDRVLGTDANTKGTAFKGSFRILEIWPLSVLFHVSELDRLALVVSLRVDPQFLAPSARNGQQKAPK